MVNYHRVQATQAVVGSITYTTHLKAYAYKPEGSGPGGDLITDITVANTTYPIGANPMHLKWLMRLVLDADEVAGFYTTNYAKVPGTVVPTLTVTETAISDADGTTKTRTVTFAPAYVKNVAEMVLENRMQDQHAYFEVIFSVYGAPSFGAWA